MNNEHKVRKKKRLTTPSLATTLLSIVSFPLLSRSRRGGGDAQLVGWRPDPRFFGQWERIQMPSPTSYQRRGVKVFTGKPSAVSEWNLTNGAFPPSSKGHFGTVRYSIWHLSTADGTLKAVSLLLWSVFLTPTADRRIHSRWSFFFFPVEGLEFFCSNGSRVEG